MVMREEENTKRRASQLYDLLEKSSLEPGSFASLQAIHQYLFQDVYEFAGQLRTVNISKGNFRFCSVVYLPQAIKKIEQLPQSTFDEIIEKYVEMNVAHPFREGNGRSMRIWLNQLLKSAIDKIVDWSQMDKEEYLTTMALSPVDSHLLKVLLQQALTDRVGNRELYLKGIDHSWYFEGFMEYKAVEL